MLKYTVFSEQNERDSMRKGLHKIVIPCVALIILLSGCDYENDERSYNVGDIGDSAVSGELSSPSGEESVMSSSIEASSSVTVSSSSAVESSVDPAVSSSSDITELPAPFGSWTEREYIADLFLNGSFYGREEPFDSAARTRVYELNEVVKTLTVTDTGFYKLDNGDYIAIDCVDTQQTYFEATLKKSVPSDPPENTVGSVGYDPKAALDYAEQNWNKGESFCAGFATECLTAGGLDYDYSSSTRLFNLLVDSGLGYAVIFDLNDDGTAYAPDCAFPGDLVFLYCQKENQMVHTAVYNGATKDGIIKACAHNPGDNGEKKFRYFTYCHTPCRYKLNKMAMFCFYRDDVGKTPENAPVIEANVSEDGVRLSWQADFLYKDSTVIVSDSSGKEICRRRMGSELSEFVELSSPGEYTAAVEMKISDTLTVGSEKISFAIEIKSEENSGESSDVSAT